LIAEGVLDGDGTIEDLGSRLGVGARHLRRLFAQHLGASPVAVAQSRRVHFARRLVDETTLSVTDVALGSGFASVRRFNDVFRRTFGFSPSRTRSARRAQQSGPLTLRLPFVPPYDWRSMLAFLARRATPGVEVVEANAYRRSIEIDGNVIGLEVQNANDEHCLRLNVRAAPPVDLLRIVSRVRRLFDLDCDPRPIAEHFKRDAHLAAVVRRHPGLRLPGTWDPFELAVRAILGQQVSVTAASTLAGRVVGAFGLRVSIDLPGVTHLFPAPSRLADADIERLGVSSVRARAIRTLAQRIANQSLVLDRRQDVDATIHALNAMPGIGPWTTQYIAMRALHEPDALPAEDLGLRKALARNGDTPSRAEIIRHAERWRPFRAYAVIHLWKSLE
jgi:AraC family transcriptional regulator of adaptative response / DNA-3-methyladenine glycosylase II